MARVGTCQSCGARFKVPETTKATRAKCSKCGGVVQIPPAAGAQAPAAPAPARPAAPARAAPPGGAPAPSRGTAGRRPGETRGRSAATADAPAGAAAPAAGARRARAAGGKARGSGRAAGRRGGGGSKPGSDDAGKKKPVLLIVLGAVVVLGVAAWFFFVGGGDAPAATPASTAGEAGGETGDAATPEGEGGAEASAAPEVITTPDPDLIAPDDQAQAPAAGEQAAAPQAPAPVAPDEGQGGPLDPVLAFEPVPVWPGVTQEQHDAWADLIHAYYMEGKPPRERKVLRQQLDEIDPIDSVPAFINSLIGLDMSDEIQVRNAFELVDYWQERVAKVPHFSFLDFTRMEPEDIDKRVQVVLAWKTWAEGKIDAPETIEKYRLDVAAAQAEGASGDG